MFILVRISEGTRAGYLIRERALSWTPYLCEPIFFYQTPVYRCMWTFLDSLGLLMLIDCRCVCLIFPLHIHLVALILIWSLEPFKTFENIICTYILLL